MSKRSFPTDLSNQRYGRARARLQLRLNRVNVICICCLLLVAFGIAIHHDNQVKQLQVNRKSMDAAGNAHPSPAIGTAKNQNPKATGASEYYLLDGAHNQWSYNGPGVSVDVKKLHDESLQIWYYVADIVVKDPAAILSGMSDDTDPAKKRALPGDLAMRYKAVISTNGDLYVARNTGIIIRNGKLLRNVPHEPILAFYNNGDMKVFNPTERNARQLLDEGVTNTFAFGPILIRDGVIDHAALKADYLRLPNPRTGIGLIAKNHYISVVVEGRQPGYSNGITLDNFALLFEKLGCSTAYNLDGGQSSAIMFMGQTLNSHANDMNGTKWNTYRHVSEILMFGTSQLIPTSETVYGKPPS